MEDHPWAQTVTSSLRLQQPRLAYFRAYRARRGNRKTNRLDDLVPIAQIGSAPSGHPACSRTDPGQIEATSARADSAALSPGTASPRHIGQVSYRTKADADKLRDPSGIWKFLARNGQEPFAGNRCRWRCLAGRW